MARYTVRVEEVAEGWVAWIDQNGEICIRQENAPGKDGFFATQAEAKAWADKHADELETGYLAAIAENERKRAMEDAQHKANLAMAESVETLKAQNAALLAILEKLNTPSA